jgi:hypothetical protein
MSNPQMFVARHPHDLIPPTGSMQAPPGRGQQGHRRIQPRSKSPEEGTSIGSWLNSEISRTSAVRQHDPSGDRRERPHRSEPETPGRAPATPPTFELRLRNVGSAHSVNTSGAMSPWIWGKFERRGMTCVVQWPVL